SHDIGRDRPHRRLGVARRHPTGASAMNTESNAAPPDAPEIKTAAFPRWPLGLGFLSMLGSAVLAARLIWEMTVLSWERGVQMVGFALVHSSNAWLLLCPLVL